jgi:hypothetical protein
MEHNYYQIVATGQAILNQNKIELGVFQEPYDFDLFKEYQTGLSRLAKRLILKVRRQTKNMNRAYGINRKKKAALRRYYTTQMATHFTQITAVMIEKEKLGIKSNKLDHNDFLTCQLWETVNWKSRQNNTAKFWENLTLYENNQDNIFVIAIYQMCANVEDRIYYLNKWQGLD